LPLIADEKNELQSNCIANGFRNVPGLHKTSAQVHLKYWLGHTFAMVLLVLLDMKLVQAH
jgi:hypothetical protein